MTQHDSGAEPTRLSSFTRDSLTFDVRDTGPIDGPPVVLLHGFPQRATCWDAVTPLLHEAGLRTLAPDQRGYSPGARPRGRAAYRRAELVADVAALIDAVGSPVHLVGHDWGAATGWAVAAAHPESVRSWTAISVGHPRSFLAALKTPAQARRSWYMAMFQLPRVPEAALTSPALGKRFLRGSGMSREAFARFRTEIVEDGALGPALNWYRAVPLDARDGVARVRVPTTMVWSDGDVALGREGAAGSEEFVRAPYEFVEIPGGSHWLPEERPEEVAAAILARVASTDGSDDPTDRDAEG